MRRVLSVIASILLAAGLLPAAKVRAAGTTGIQFKSISAGRNHTLALASDGTVFSWGGNYSEQLADESTSDRGTAVRVSGLSNMASIVATGYYNYGVKSDGTLWRWGDFYGGPEELSDISNISSIDSRSGHILVLKKDGTVWASGDNSHGVLGDGTTDSKYSDFVQAKGLANVIQVATGDDHSLALKSDGTVWAWGDNYYGATGLGSEVSVPTQITGLSGVVYITGGEDCSLAIKSDGTVWGWGKNYYTGADDIDEEDSPVQIEGLTDIKQVKCGGEYNLALKKDGLVLGWGKNNLKQLGEIAGTTVLTPTVIPDLTNITMIAAGNGHCAALNSSGNILAWGYNMFCQAGTGSFDTKSRALKIDNISNVKSVAVGAGHRLALKNDGTVWAWGCNGYGQVGDGTKEDKYTPIQVNGLTDIVQITARGITSYALKSDGTVYGWGSDLDYQLSATYGEYLSPIKLAGISNVKKIAAGEDFILFLKNDGTVWGQGNNSEGELAADGYSLYYDSPVPIMIPGLTGITDIAAGRFHALALKNDGSVWAWGYNDYHQLGADTTYTRNTVPVKAGIDNVAYVSAGYDNSAAIKKDGTVWVWGSNGCNSLGLPDNMSTVYKPTQVPGLNNVKEISLGLSTTLFIKNDDSVLISGWELTGSEGLYISHYTPTPAVSIDKLKTGALVVSYYLGVSEDGTLWAWGDSEDGYFGNMSLYIQKPTQVKLLATAYPKDLNYDGTVDLGDLALLSRCYNAKEYERLYCKKYDFNTDYVIDVYDLVAMSKALY
ncbi:MAG: hypothetical protein Q8930_11330 [Bacillota bacterium]|nr:hypothetical protein [Bacillota bacterium]